jgi:hypothetical protein
MQMEEAHVFPLGSKGPQIQSWRLTIALARYGLVRESVTGAPTVRHCGRRRERAVDDAAHQPRPTMAALIICVRSPMATHGLHAHSPHA